MKRALNSLTETAAVTWAREGIRVNGITPGGTATEMIDDVGGGDPRHHRAHQHQRSRSAGWPSPARSPRRPRGCSATAPRMVTGAIVPVDGGAGA